MSDNGFDVTIPNGLQPYQNGDMVYRAVLYEDYIKDGKIKYQAFYRRNSPKDNQGLSINPTEQTCRNNPNLREPIHGIGQLTAGEIRSVQKRDGTFLEVVPDSSDHGNIKRVPRRDSDENTADAIRLAMELARFVNSRTVL